MLLKIDNFLEELKDFVSCADNDCRQSVFIEKSDSRHLDGPHLYWSYSVIVELKMSKESQQIPPIFRIDVSPEGADEIHPSEDEGSLTAQLLQQLVIGQERQNELLEDLVEQMNASQRSRANELGQWKEANPDLAYKCREAAEALSMVQTEFLDSLTEEIKENADQFMTGDFMMNEFVDRFGPRLAHLNGVLQVLTQLSSSQPPQMF